MVKVDKLVEKVSRMISRNQNSNENEWQTLALQVVVYTCALRCSPMSEQLPEPALTAWCHHSSGKKGAFLVITR